MPKRGKPRHHTALRFLPETARLVQLVAERTGASKQAVVEHCVWYALLGEGWPGRRPTLVPASLPPQPQGPGAE